MSAEEPAKAHAAAASALPSPGEADYEAICAAVFATERGRWFLAEYARRNRQADTADLVAAIERIASRSGADARLPSGPPPCDNALFERLRTELAETTDAIARARTELASATAGAAPDGTLEHAVRPGGAATERLDILSAAEDIQELAWTMREQGFDSQFGDRLDRCAAAICLASSGRNRGMRRVRKIRHMMRHLQRRIDAIIAMLNAAPAMRAGAQDDVAPKTPSPDDAPLRQATPLLLGIGAQAAEPAEASRIPPCAAADDSERDSPQDDSKGLGPVLVRRLPEKPGKEQTGEGEDSTTWSTDIAEPVPADAPTRRAGRNVTTLTIEGPKGSFSIMPARAAEVPDLIPPPPLPPPPPPLETDSTASDMRAFALELASEAEADGLRSAQSPVADQPPTPSVVNETGTAPTAAAANDDDIFRQGEVDLPLAEAPRLGEPPPAPAAARASADIAEHLLADVMALSEEERVALFT